MSDTTLFSIMGNYNVSNKPDYLLLYLRFKSNQITLFSKNDTKVIIMYTMEVGLEPREKP